MRAAVYNSYGPADRLRIREIDEPRLDGPGGDGRVIVAVKAVALNPLDWHLLSGTPYIVRAQSGLFKPKRTIPGVDVAGTVTSIGSAVTRFQPGDEVFGWSDGGGCADYVAVDQDQLVTIPPGIDFEQAAAVPIAGLTALQALRDKGGLDMTTEGDRPRVLINGASGGVGTFAVQIAKAFGADVTAVCRTGNLDLVADLGADRLIDYTAEDPLGGPSRYDVMLDGPGDRPLRACRRILTDDGRYVLIGGSKARFVGPLPRLLTMITLSPLVGQTFSPLLSRENLDDLQILRDMLEQGSLRPVIDRRYQLDETAEAMRYQSEGHARGKIVITM